MTLPASYALRFAAGFEGIRMVLSGMSSMEQMEDNLSFMKDFRPLDQQEPDAIDRVRDIFNFIVTGISRGDLRNGNEDIIL